MRILLDTHMILWALADDERLSEKARRTILSSENEIYCSLASLWEIQIKHTIHPDEMPDATLVWEGCREAGFSFLQIEEDSFLHLATLPLLHRDPFDRLLLAQAETKGMTLLTVDSKILAYQSAFTLAV